MNAIAYNGRFLSRQGTGVDRFAAEVMRAVSGLAPATAAVLVPRSAASVPSPAANSQVVAAGAMRGHLWEQFELSAAAGNRPLLNLCNTAPAHRENQLVVIHDAATLANPRNYGIAFRNWYRWLLGALMRRARVIASVSRFSADELVRHLGARPRGIEVIPEGGEHILREPADVSVLARLRLEGRRYVLALGSRSPNKNLAGLQAALALLDDPGLLLVAAGGANPRVFAGVSLDAGRTVFTGYLADRELRALYEHAECFVFPSFYEGFGLPPLEAMCCGCPVIVSDRSSLPEVCGDAALYCDPADPASIATSLRRLLASPALRAELREAGLGRAAGFGWNKAGAQLAQILDKNFA